ncbi:TPA: hypothetical protein N0F65_007520 [Lagenidium giganteum]|uniref:Uncharacterized protein n=1 Tax=Lagenidium giganteum TaxID=4803 RepID=A0AAV2ZNF4_9STRA|nr:TPA: hypothetical protein N0F65_007520 [Lagenidium giganteum]
MGQSVRAQGCRAASAWPPGRCGVGLRAGVDNFAR